MSSCYHKVWRENEGDKEGKWKIALPTTLLQPTVRWYHQVLGHCGSRRLYDTICRRFFVPGLKKVCKELQCAHCQKKKLLGPGYGLLPPRFAQLMPWNEVSVDLIGPWKLSIRDLEVEFNAAIVPV